jgi:hypothetical protein
MTALHARLGGGVLRSYNKPGTRVRKWWVNLAAVRVGLTRDPADTEEAIGGVLLRLEDLEKKSEAFRQSHNALKRKVNQLEFRFTA